MKKTILLSLLLALSSVANADIVVVASQSLGLDSMTRTDVAQVFSGKIHTVNGVDLKPVDLPSQSETRTAFYSKVLDKTAAQMRAHWARMTFTGKGQPPRIVSGPAQLQGLISSPGSNWIGYMDSGQLGAAKGLKVLYRVK